MWCTQYTTSGKSNRGDAHVVHPMHYIGEIQPGRRPCGAPSTLHRGNPAGAVPMWCTQCTTSGKSGRGDAHVVHPAHYIREIQPGRRPCGAPSALHRGNSVGETPCGAPNALHQGNPAQSTKADQTEKMQKTREQPLSGSKSAHGTTP